MNENVSESYIPPIVLKGMGTVEAKRGNWRIVSMQLPDRRGFWCLIEDIKGNLVFPDSCYWQCTACGKCLRCIRSTMFAKDPVYHMFHADIGNLYCIESPTGYHIPKRMTESLCPNKNKY